MMPVLVAVAKSINVVAGLSRLGIVAKNVTLVSSLKATLDVNVVNARRVAKVG
jgi:hypothetical protein